MSQEDQIDRREAVARIAGGAMLALAGGTQTLLAEEAVPRTGLGMVSYNCGLRRRSMQDEDPDFDLFEPLTFLRHCRSLGAGGMQASLGVLAPERIRTLRDFADRHSLFIEAIVRPPHDDADLSRFEAEIRTAADVGALARTLRMVRNRAADHLRQVSSLSREEQVELEDANIAKSLKYARERLDL